MRIYWYWPFVRREELGLASALPRSGDRLFVHATPRSGDEHVEAIGPYELDVSLPQVRDVAERSVPWMASRAWTYVDRVAKRSRALRRGEFDVCHLMFLNYFTDWVDLSRLRRRVPLVSSVHDVVPHESRVPRGVERRLLASQYRNAGTIVVLHERIRRRLCEEFEISPGRVEVIPLQIPAAPSHRAHRDEGSASRNVLFFGTLRRNKGAEVLLAAIDLLRDIPNLRFIVAGRGASDVEMLVREAATRDSRIIAEIGYATAQRKAQLYSDADIVVLPYTSFASQSAVLSDAYGYGVPVVVADVGALGDTVREEGTGWVVRPGDSVALAEAIAGLSKNTEELRRVSIAQLEIAKERSPQRIAGLLRSLYERVAMG